MYIHTQHTVRTEFPCKMYSTNFMLLSIWQAFSHPTWIHLQRNVCVRVRPSVCVCVCIGVVFLTSVKWALASWFSRLAVTVLCNTACLPLPPAVCCLPITDYSLPFYFCWSPIFDFCLSTRCSYAQCARRKCNAPHRVYLCVCVCVCKLMTQILLQNVAISLACFGLFHLLFNARAKNQHQ